jgi:hypothetical protein
LWKTTGSYRVIDVSREVKEIRIDRNIFYYIFGRFITLNRYVFSNKNINFSSQDRISKIVTLIQRHNKRGSSRLFKKEDPEKGKIISEEIVLRGKITSKKAKE